MTEKTETRMERVGRAVGIQLSSRVESSAVSRWWGCWWRRRWCSDVYVVLARESTRGGAGWLDSGGSAWKRDSERMECGGRRRVRANQEQTAKRETSDGLAAVKSGAVVVLGVRVRRRESGGRGEDEGESGW